MLRTAPRFYKTAVNRQTIFSFAVSILSKKKPKSKSTLIFNLTVAFGPEIFKSIKKFQIFQKIFKLNGGFQTENLILKAQKVSTLVRKTLETGTSYF